MIDVYYAIGEDDSLWWVEKTFFDKEGYINDYDADKNYRKIENALESVDCPRLMEANAELLISEKEMVDEMKAKGFNMILNNEILD
jgi:hypothetical protein